MTIRRTSIVALLATALLPLTVSAKQHKPKMSGLRVDWKTVPPTAQNAIQSSAPDGKVGDVYKDVKNGITVYRAEVKMKDRTINRVSVSEDGKVLKVKADDSRKHKHRPLFGSRASAPNSDLS